MGRPIIILAGQSNASRISDEVRDALEIEFGPGNFDLVEVYAAGAPLTRPRDGKPDWFTASELPTALAAATVEALSRDGAGRVEGVIWVQGEGDTHGAGQPDSYGSDFNALWSDTAAHVVAAHGSDGGLGAAPVVIAELSDAAPAAAARRNWDAVIAAQAALGMQAGISTIDPDTLARTGGLDAAAMFMDDLHYSDDFSTLLADALVGELFPGPAGPLDDVIGVIPGPNDMPGSTGDDTYHVDHTDDRVAEQAGEGFDHVVSSASFALWRSAGWVEALTLTGDADLNGAGNALANRLTGNSGNNRLDGGAGADTILGGAGDDVIRPGTGPDLIATGPGSDRVSGTSAELAGDVVADFSPRDSIVITGTGPAALSAVVHADHAVIHVTDAGPLLRLDGDFRAGAFAATGDGDQARVTFAPVLPPLQEGVPLDGDLRGSHPALAALSGRITVTRDDAARSGHDNRLGVYEVDGDGTISDVRLLFADTRTETIRTGDADHRFGFFLVQDGDDWARALDQADRLDFARTGPDAPPRLTVNGRAADVEVFHSIDPEWNGDGLTHAVAGLDSDGRGLVVGFEDLTGGGDLDFQDFLFRVEDWGHML
ncbi:MAG: DUF4114 domain-containing protein [Pseudooceanicola sp.]